VTLVSGAARAECGYVTVSVATAACGRVTVDAGKNDVSAPRPPTRFLLPPDTQTRAHTISHARRQHQGSMILLSSPDLTTSLCCGQPGDDICNAQQTYKSQVCSRHKKFCRLDWTEQCFTSRPTQYRLYGRRFLQVNSIKVLKEQIVHRQIKHTIRRHINTIHSKSPSLH